MRMLSFEWNAPLEFGPLRFKRTQVVIMFEEQEENVVQVSLTQLGWEDSAEWDRLYEYFDQAWTSVLRSMAAHFISGKR